MPFIITFFNWRNLNRTWRKWQRCQHLSTALLKCRLNTRLHASVLVMVENGRKFFWTLWSISMYQKSRIRRTFYTKSRRGDKDDGLIPLFFSSKRLQYSRPISDNIITDKSVESLNQVFAAGREAYKAASRRETFVESMWRFLPRNSQAGLLFSVNNFLEEPFWVLVPSSFTLPALHRSRTRIHLNCYFW